MDKPHIHAEFNPRALTIDIRIRYEELLTSLSSPELLKLMKDELWDQAILCASNNRCGPYWWDKLERRSKDETTKISLSKMD